MIFGPLTRAGLLIISILPLAHSGADGAIFAVPLLIVAGWLGWKVPFTEAEFRGNRRLEAAQFWVLVSVVTLIFWPSLVVALLLARPVAKRLNGPAYATVDDSPEK
ncbi:hypothetical protein LP422_17540 [Janibacter limosus]|uniref:Uncharacterized protein n=1 Tax=Janibacter limosus TaxID=53458 RepID=A0AC61U2N4_9MICO|nr:hypothetical protein [Janibacter limosus]UUZ44272.1 hypothetical protein LP422_17540 [Janibacter limosus]